MRRSGSGMPTRRSQSIAFARAAAPRRYVVGLDRLDDLVADAHHRLRLVAGS